MSGMDVDLLVRALGREKRIEAPEKRKSILKALPELERRPSATALRPSPDPSVHAHGVDQARRGRGRIRVTRSIGDWDGSRAMVLQPAEALYSCP